MRETRKDREAIGVLVCEEDEMAREMRKDSNANGSIVPEEGKTKEEDQGKALWQGLLGPQ